MVIMDRVLSLKAAGHMGIQLTVKIPRGFPLRVVLS